MLKKIEKWALQRLLKRAMEKIPEAKGKIAQIWDLYSDEIFEKVVEAIEKTIATIIKKALAKQGIEFLDNTNN